LLNGLILLIWFRTLLRPDGDALSQGLSMAFIVEPYALSTIAGTLFAGLRLSARGPELPSKIKAVRAVTLIVIVVISGLSMMLAL
jgi:hypothetical protein